MRIAACSSSRCLAIAWLATASVCAADIPPATPSDCARAFASSGGADAAVAALAHHLISTSDPASQALFDRGLTLYYAYNGSEGVHVFEKLALREPRLAMAYWGEALSYGSDFNQTLTEENFAAAHTAIGKAVLFEAGASEAERAYIDAMRLRYAGAWQDHAQAETAYRQAMSAAFAKFPQDDDLGSLYVEALLEKKETAPLWKPGTDRPAGMETQTMVDVLERIVARNPAHVMANHLILHVFELSADRRRALASAERLNHANLAPEDEHLAHMAVHAFVRAGDYAQAVTASCRAIALFDRYLATPGIDRTHAPYIWHDLMHAHAAAMMLGNHARAKWFVDRLDAQPKHTDLAALTSARFGRWDEVARAAPKDAADPAHFALAMMQLKRGDVARARAELPDALGGKGAMSYLLYALRGAADVLQGRRDAANANFEKALAHEKDAYVGAEIPLFPSGEIIGGAYLRAGDAGLAERAYRDALALYPNDARALYGLSEALKRQGRRTEADAKAAESAAAWKGSDTALGAAGW